MGGRFMEDPDVEAALSGGGGGGGGAPAFQEDPAVEAALSQPAPERGNSTPFVEPDPNMHSDLWSLTDARNDDLARNGGVGLPERLSEAAVAANFPGARAGGSYLGNMGRNAISGGIQAGAASYRDTGNPLEALLAGGRGMIMGAGLTGLGTAAGAAGSKVAAGADAFGDFLGAHADEARVLSTGKPAPDVERLGAPGRAELAGNIEREGLNAGWGPATPKTYARNSEALMGRGQRGMAGAEDQINALPAPPQVPVADIITQNRNQADRVSGLADPANEGVAGFRNSMIDRLESDTITPGRGPVATMAPSGWNGHQYMQPGSTVDLPSGQLPWDRALEQRRNIDQNTNWQQQGANEPWNNATRKEVGGQLRGAIDESLNTPNVPPEMASQWRTGRDQYALGAGVNEDATNALGNTPGLKIPTNIRGVVGNAAGPAVRYGGYSALAGGLRGAQGMAQGVEGVVGANSEALTGIAQRGGGALGAAAAQNPSISGWLQSKGVSLENVPQQSRGNQLGDAAQRLLQTEPQALGQYQQQFQQAAQQGTTALNQLIIKLEREPDFRTGPMLRLQHMTGEN